jgi:hypothetical protein
MPKLQEMLSPASSHGEDEFDEDSFSPRSRTRRGSSRSERDKDGDAALWDDDSGFEDELTDDLGSRNKPSKTKTRPSLARGAKSSQADDAFSSDLDDNADDLFSKPSRGRFGQTAHEPEATEMAVTEPFKRSAVIQAEHVTPASTPNRPDNFASAIEKLRSMGVDQFHLVPGLAAGQFLFVCQVEAAGESGTIHRFEAEAGDPTAAVADVMKQLSAWQADSSVTRTAGAEFRR